MRQEQTSLTGFDLKGHTLIEGLSAIRVSNATLGTLPGALSDGESEISRRLQMVGSHCPHVHLAAL